MCVKLYHKAGYASGQDSREQNIAGASADGMGKQGQTQLQQLMQIAADPLKVAQLGVDDLHHIAKVEDAFRASLVQQQVTGIFVVTGIMICGLVAHVLSGGPTREG